MLPDADSHNLTNQMTSVRTGHDEPTVTDSEWLVLAADRDRWKRRARAMFLRARVLRAVNAAPRIVVLTRAYRDIADKRHSAFERMRLALEWYADPDNWPTRDDDSRAAILRDDGRLARASIAALKGARSDSEEDNG